MGQISITATLLLETGKTPYGPYELSYRVELEGDPTFHVELDYVSRTDVNKTGRSPSVMPAVNAIPAVCGARSGLLGPLDVPRYWSRNIRPIGLRDTE